MPELIGSGKIYLCSEKQWVAMTKSEREAKFPCYLKSDNGKVRIRFDTNGELFKKKEHVDRFICGIYELHLKHVKIDLTLSIKGTSSFEVAWFINQKTPFDPSRLGTNEPIDQHPQWGAIENIINAIAKNEPQDVIEQASENIISETYFNPCGEVSLTIEKGIMNNPKERLYLYDREALEWDQFALKLESKGLKLSNTENRIYLGQYPTAKAWSYLNMGNYELRLKCSHYRFHNTDLPFLTYSKSQQSISRSEEHRRIVKYADMNHLSATLKSLKETNGKKCRYSSIVCEYWIELVPV